MKVLLTNFHPNNGGGHTTYLLYLFRELTKLKDIDVFLACPKTSRLYKMAGEINPNHLFAIDFPAKVKELGQVIKNTRQLSALIRKYQFNILHVNGNPDHKMAMYGKLFNPLNKAFKYKIVRTKHDSKAIKNNLFSRLQYQQFIDQMIVVSRFQLQSLNNIELLNKTSAIHNGIDLEQFKPLNKNNSLRHELSIKEDDLIFVSVAGTALHKGWQYLVKAVSLLEPTLQKKIKIILAGGIPKEKVLQQYVYDLGLSEQVIFTGLIDNVKEIVALGDVGFVLSTSVETISFACREMMAMGKPTIVSNYAGLPENIDHGVNGWVVNIDNDVQELKQILINILSLDLAEFSTQAHLKAEHEFGVELFINKTIGNYEESLLD